MQFATLALVTSLALAHCEWVEISQHHHRPRKPTTNTTIPSNWHQTPDDLDRWSQTPGERRPTEDNLGDNKKITVAPDDEDSGDAIRTEVPVLAVKDSLVPTRAFIEKVSNVGSVKRVQLPNTPIKSPTIKISDRKHDQGHTIPDKNQDSDEFVIKADIFKDRYEEVMSPPSTNNRKFSYNKIKSNANVDYTNSGDSQLNFDISQDNVDRKHNIMVNSDDKDVKKEENEIMNKDKVRNNIDRPKKNSLHVLNDHREKNHDFKYPDDKTPQSNEFKVNTMENILKFVKVVTETISKNVRRSLNGKVKYLNELRDGLLHNIKYRIDACWPDDSPTGQRGRRSRAAPHTARGHVEFPSSDSALMTISFLTFAVFLIKLVLQVIQTYKNKAMIMAPVMVATSGRRAARKQGKH